MHLTKHSQVHRFAHCPDVRPPEALPRIVSLADMLEFDATLLLRFARGAGHLDATSVALRKFNPDRTDKQWEQVPEDSSPGMALALTIVAEQCRFLGLLASAKAATRLAQAYERHSENTLSGLRELSLDLESRLRDELEGRLCFMIEPSRTHYFKGDAPPFAASLPLRFQGAEHEFLEACRCFALDRATACVFHLMRAIETPLSVIAKRLKLNLPVSPTWGDYLKEMKTAIAALPSKTLRHKQRREYYSGLEAHIHAIKNAWRNPTMHRIDAVYTDEQARDLIELVRGFIRTAARI
jgi:hypothetical protein